MRITENDYLYTSDINGKKKGPYDNIVVLRNRNDNGEASHRFHMLQDSGPLKSVHEEHFEQNEEEPDKGEFLDASA